MKSSRVVGKICSRTFYYIKDCSFRELYYWIIFLIRSLIFTSFAKVIEFKTLLDYLDLQKGEKVCDLGCGQGNNDLLLSLAGADMYAVDIDTGALSLGKRNAERLQVTVNYSIADLNGAIGFRSDSFHSVLSYCVLEHLSNPEVFLTEVYRILRPGGAMAISVDSFSHPSISDKFKKTHAKVCDVKRYYSKRDVELLLNECGFCVARSSFIIKSRISRILFEMLLCAYFRSEIQGNSQLLRLLKLFTPVFLVICMMSDYFCDDSNGGYWIALLAVKET